MYFFNFYLVSTLYYDFYNINVSIKNKRKTAYPLTSLHTKKNKIASSD